MFEPITPVDYQSYSQCHQSGRRRVRATAARAGSGSPRRTADPASASACSGVIDLLRAARRPRLGASSSLCQRPSLWRAML